MTAKDGPPKILIVAPNASSRFGGESFLPLKYFQILRRRGHPVLLLTHARNREDLETAFPQARDAIFYIEDSRAHRAIWKAGSYFPEPLRGAVFGTALYLVNDLFQSRLIRQLVQEGRVDVIHQPAPVSPKQPSSIYGFGVPVVIGPMNGGMSYPPGYEDHESAWARRFVALSRRIARAMNVLIPGKRHAAALLVANSRTHEALPTLHPNVIELVENGVDLSIWTNNDSVRTSRQPNNPFRLIFMGRLVAWKAIDITLEAIRIARAAGHDLQLDILGEGEERAALETQVQQLGLEGAVRFLGFLPQTDCAAHLRQADALILNSLYECGGAVVLEAMSVGLPVIASDWGGPADYLDPSCGFLVAPIPREDFADRLADAIAQLAEDPELAQQMGEAGRARIMSEFDWEKKVDRVTSIYAEVLKDWHRQSPDLFKKRPYHSGWDN